MPAPWGLGFSGTPAVTRWWRPRPVSQQWVSSTATQVSHSSPSAPSACSADQRFEDQWSSQAPSVLLGSQTSASVTARLQAALSGGHSMFGTARCAACAFSTPQLSMPWDAGPTAEPLLVSWLVTGVRPQWPVVCWWAKLSSEYHYYYFSLTWIYILLSMLVCQRHCQPQFVVIWILYNATSLTFWNSQGKVDHKSLWSNQWAVEAGQKGFDSATLLGPELFNHGLVYGLAAAVFTQNLNCAIETAHKLQAWVSLALSLF